MSLDTLNVCFAWQPEKKCSKCWIVWWLQLHNIIPDIIFFCLIRTPTLSWDFKIYDKNTHDRRVPFCQQLRCAFNDAYTCTLECRADGQTLFAEVWTTWATSSLCSLGLTISSINIHYAQSTSKGSSCKPVPQLQSSPPPPPLLAALQQPYFSMGVNGNGALCHLIALYSGDLKL